MTQDAESAGGSVWQRFRARNLFDYSAAAQRVWLGLVLLGVVAGAWALYRVTSSLDDIQALAITIVIVLVAGRFPLVLPRTSIVFTGSDIFLFGVIVLLGTPAAVIAGGIDSLVSAKRRSRRLSSWLVSPATSMIGMSIAGTAYEAQLHGMVLVGLNPGAAAIASVCVAGMIHYLVNTGLLHTLVSIKRGSAFQWGDWLVTSGWMAAVTLLSAFLGGLLVVVNKQVGVQAVGVAALVALAVMYLLHLSFRRVEAQRVEQESQIALAREEARINAQRFSAAFTNAAGGLAIAAGDGRILRVNQALCDLLRRDESAFVGASFLDLLVPDDRPPVQPRLAELVGQPDGTFSAEVRLQRTDGEVWVSLHASPFEDPGASGIGLIYQVHDITERREAQAQLQYAAYHDGLTGLPNRLAFMTRLEDAIRRSTTDQRSRFAVLLLDLDRFKMVNDSLGHAAGNDLLTEIGERLKRCVRPHDRVARLGGDEFAVLFDGVGSQEEAMRLARRVADTLNEPVQMSGTEFSVQASIGLTLSDLGHRNADEMIRDADIAMYDAKGSGRGRISVFDTSMHEYVANRLHMEAELRKAIGAGQITLAYQPIFELETRRLLGFEALSRWRHPEMGQVEVPKFIALAEESGFIAQLTPWVIEMAALQMAGWQKVLPHGERLKMHVNVSARDLGLPGFTTSVATALARARLSGHALTLEITETSLMQSVEHALPVMEALRRIGVGFSIDDFGTGYSSLSYLSTLPIDSLKIDRSFVIGMDRGPQNVEIVRAIQRLGQTLHMHVIAEGVETQEHLVALRDIGVEAGQGYLFARPLPPGEALQQLQAVAAG